MLEQFHKLIVLLEGYPLWVRLIFGAWCVGGLVLILSLVFAPRNSNSGEAKIRTAGIQNGSLTGNLYDVAFSFAGEDRSFVHEVAVRLREAGATVFYDEFHEIELWGENLPEKLDQVYRTQSKFVVVYISESYVSKVWTRFEIKSVLAAAISSPEPFLLPARFDDTDLPGVQPTISYVDLRKETPETFALKILEKIKEDTPRGEPERVFSDEDSFRVLLLPFDPLEKVQSKDVQVERAIQKRLLDVKSDEDLELEVAFLNRGLAPIQASEGADIGRKLGAQLVIWGDYYQSSSTDETKDRLRWALVDLSLPNVTPSGKTPILSMESLAMISEGFLQGDIDYIIAWALGHLQMNRGNFERAVKRFESVAARHGDKFPQVTSFSMDESGFHFRIERPAVHLLFYLGFCYQRLGETEKAIHCWTHILTGSSRSEGGSFFGWDSLGTAIGSGNPEEVKGLLYVLLSRAHAYTALGDSESAVRDFRTVLMYAKSAEGNSELDSVFQPLVSWIQGELGIVLDTETSKLHADQVLKAFMEALQHED